MEYIIGCALHKNLKCNQNKRNRFPEVSPIICDSNNDSDATFIPDLLAYTVLHASCIKNSVREILEKNYAKKVGCLTVLKGKFQFRTNS